MLIKISISRIPSQECRIGLEYASPPELMIWLQ
jgi:hypothetical protein